MRIGILGFGVEGKSLLEYLQKRDAKRPLPGEDITVLDRDEKLKVEPGVKTILGEEYLEYLTDFDVIFRSPGIPFLTPEIQKARKAGVKISSLTKYFFEHCPCAIIGVTGTKGKGTTSTLITKILEKAGKRAYLGGNIGDSPLEFLDKLQKDDIAVMELSSFQLQDIEQSPHVAILLRTTSEHLDHHKSVKEYRDAKWNILVHQKKSDTAVIHQSNKKLPGIPKKHGKLISVSTDMEPKNDSAYVAGETLILKEGKKKMKICDKRDVALLGPHNLENVLAACAAVHALGIPVDAMKSVIKSFKGLPHRLEPVGEAIGARYYNDSFSTTPETSIAAINSFEEPIILMAGGSEKHSDFDMWAAAVAGRLNVKSVILMGETSRRMEAALDKAVAKKDQEIMARVKKGEAVLHRTVPLDVVFAQSGNEAFMTAVVLAEPGDVVLLSPGAASFGLFENYKDRGKKFMEFVKSIAA